MGEVENLLEDREGHWLTLRLTGTPHQSLSEWRKSHNDEFYVNRKPLLKSVGAGVEGVFVATEFREVEPSLEWKSNCIDLSYPGEGLPDLRAVANELGYGLDGAGVGALDPGPPKGEAKSTKNKKLKGRARVREMVRKSAWDWKGSALDPEFRPRIGLKRKRDCSGSSETSTSSRSFGE